MTDRAFNSFDEAWKIVQDQLADLQNLMKQTGHQYCAVKLDLFEPGNTAVEFRTGCGMTAREKLMVEVDHVSLRFSETNRGQGVASTEEAVEMSLGDVARVIAFNISDLVDADGGVCHGGIIAKFPTDCAPEIRTINPETVVEMPIETSTPAALKHWLEREFEKLREEFFERIEAVAQNFVNDIERALPGSNPEAISGNGHLFVELDTPDGDRRSTLHMRNSEIDEIWPGLAEMIENFEDWQASIDFQINDAPFDSVRANLDAAPKEPEACLPSL